MKIKKNIALSESGFVFDPSTGNSFTTNPIAIEIMELLKAGDTDTDIVSKLVLKYEVKRETAERDLQDFISHLNKLKLIQN